MAKVIDVVRQLAQGPVESCGCSLWDVEYVKEAGVWYLRLYIDKEGGVSINDCVAVDNLVSPLLDEADPIEGSYTFEVSSAGMERVLRLPEHFTACMGQEVEVKLYRAQEGKKEWVGVLDAYEDGNVTVTTSAGELTFEKKDVAQVHLHARV